jgi:ribose-phosphate pyrophosphokinase
MTARVVPGTANRTLAEGVARCLGTEPTRCEVERFPDGELCPVVDGVRGEDVYVVQPTGPPVNDHLVELLLLLDACRRAGAGRVTAVVPYFGYARQDRRFGEGSAVGARVCADALMASGAQRLIVVDPHTVALEAMWDMEVEMLTAVPVLAAALADVIAEEAVVVAPDLGAVKLAERYAAKLGRGVAVVRKTRVSGRAVQAREIIGDVASRPSVIVDDMVSTGATIEAAVEVLRAHAGGDDVTVAATHALLVAGATERVAASGVRRMLFTDTLAIPTLPDTCTATTVEVCSVAPLLADAIGRLHRNESIDDLRLAL